MTQALAQARKALENVLPTLDDLAKYRGLSYSEAQSLAVDVRSALAAIDAALEGGAVPNAVDAEIRSAANAYLNNTWAKVVSGSRSHEENWTVFERDFPGAKRLHDALDLPSPPPGA